MLTSESLGTLQRVKISESAIASISESLYRLQGRRKSITLAREGKKAQGGKKARARRRLARKAQVYQSCPRGLVDLYSKSIGKAQAYQSCPRGLIDLQWTGSCPEVLPGRRKPISLARVDV